jgi:hypothetical protein
MRRLLTLAAGAVSLAFLFGAGGASAAQPEHFLCTEGASTGCVMSLGTGGTSITVGSDGEATFDPFGAGSDTSDGIQFDSQWVGANTTGWVELTGPNSLGGNTWVLPACDSGGTCENGNVNEPVGTWEIPGATWSGLDGSAYVWGIGESGGGGWSDIITAYNGTDANGGIGAFLSFNSSPVPEPATWAMMLLGVGLVGAGLRVNRQRYAMGAGIA